MRRATIRVGAAAYLSALFGLNAGAAEHTIYSLPCYPNGGKDASGSRVTDSSGNLYTTSIGGGQFNLGTVLELAAPSGGGTAWTGTTIYSFGTADASNPKAGLLQGPSGSYYGTAYYNDDSGCDGYGCGAVFQLLPPTNTVPSWTVTVLYDFTGAPDGANPNASLVQDSAGKLFGTTLNGGIDGTGTVFQLQPPAKAGGAWAESVIYSFSGGTDGGYPAAPLLLGSGGVLYGTAMSGGVGNGVVFTLTPPVTKGAAWTQDVLYNFSAPSDGSGPIGGLAAGKARKLYGTTQFGGTAGFGTAFELVPPMTGQTVWTENLIYSFANNGDGALPAAGLYVNAQSKLYGTTEGTGGTGSYGSVFRLSPPKSGATTWTEKTLYKFSGGPDGEYPVAPLIPELSGRCLR